MSETWRIIPGFRDYEVSDAGRVRSLSFRNRYAVIERTLVLRNQPRGALGHPCVTLYQNNRPTTISVHRLVLMAFIGPCPVGREAAHLNGNPQDNKPSNLAWCTPTENNGHKKVHGTNGPGSENSQAKLTKHSVVTIRAAYQAGGITYRALARQHGVSNGTISGILARRTWSHV